MCNFKKQRTFLMVYSEDGGHTHVTMAQMLIMLWYGALKSESQ